METFILVVGFIGAWLLFAGPVYQAALELQEQDIEMDRIRAAGANVSRPVHVSVWWWLLPPAKFYLERRRSRDYRHRYMAILSPEDVEALINFMNKATAWVLVGVGGLCIAIKETYELVEHLNWQNTVFAALLVLMFSLSILNTVARVARTRQIIATKK
jgi:hypothetical protein